MPKVDFAQLARDGMSARKLSETFLQTYYSNTEITYPINPFQILKDMDIAVSFRPFDNYEGVYIPAENEDDIPVVGVNVGRPITRQRFTAAHELCHHLKDVNIANTNSVGITCAFASQTETERYAESFAAGLLMPREEMQHQISLYAVGSYISFEDVVRIADYFGVSFQACLYELAWRHHVIEGDTSPDSLRERYSDFKPSVKRAEMGLNDVLLYEQLYNAVGNCLTLDMNARAQQLFKTEYIFHDSRMEGVDIGDETAAEIVVDLRLKGAESKYCNEESENIVQVAGLTRVYDFVFSQDRQGNEEITIYDAKRINEALFSTAPCPEFGGRYRESNTLVLRAKFETADYKSVPAEMLALGKELDAFLLAKDDMPIADYIETTLRIHHKLTVIHPFCDGNGRTSRAFVNLLFTREGIAPVLFKGEEKDLYKKALCAADATGDFAQLFELYFKGILQSYAMLSGVYMSTK